MTDTRLILGILACLALACSPAALAQQGDRWFQVELLVFSNERINSVEQWQPTPDLAYPNAARFLVEPDRVQANLAQHQAESVVDEFGRQILTVLPEATEKQSPLTPDIPLGGQTAGDMAGNASMPLRPTPFIALPSSQLEFRGKAAYMQRSGGYRTLFHETWVQPVRHEASALPLILDRSGDTGQWPRLQGSIKLYLSRYLHIQTNLWLNTAGDYLPGLWRMPAPPLGPPSLIIEELPAELEPEAESPPAGWAVADGEDELAGDPNEALLAEEELGPVYPFRHAVLLQQKRRMRSTEVHYLDHPLFGLVVTLKPLGEEELEAMARAEAQAETNAN